MSRFIFTLTPLSAAIILFSASMTAHALEETKIEKIYVSGTRSESPQLPLATTITIIDQEQIRLSGATQVSEVLRTHAGIQIQDFDGSGGRNVTVSMRGFSSNAANNTLVIVDGRKLNNASLAGPALNTIALKDVERIEIVQGSAGVLYGDQAVGGVINIVTRRATRGEVKGLIQALAGSDNLESYTANVNQGFENGLSYALSAQKRNADNYRDNNQSAYKNLLANLRYDFGDGYVFVEGQTIDDNLRLPGAISEQDAGINRRKSDEPNNYSNQDTDLARIGGALDIDKNWQFLIEYADRDEQGSYFADDYLPENGYFPYLSHSRMRAKNITPRVIGNLATAHGNTVITLGYDWADSKYSTNDGFTHFTQVIDGWYGQVNYPATAQLAFTLGARYSRVDDKNRALNSANDDDLTASELGVNYKIGSSWRIFSRYAEGFRFANADENAYTLPDVNFLQEQTSESAEAGVAWDTEVASATLTAYHMIVDNEIMFDAITFANINLPESERQGLMLDAEVTLSSQINLRANYTFTDAELTSGNFEGNQVPFVAEDTANFAVVFNFTETLTVYVDANYTGARYRIGDDANSQTKVDSVILFNANILWSIKDLELGLHIRNLTDEKYADYLGYSVWSGNSQYPQPERTYEAGLTYRF